MVCYKVLPLNDPFLLFQVIGNASLLIDPMVRDDELIIEDHLFNAQEGLADGEYMDIRQTMLGRGGEGDYEEVIIEEVCRDQEEQVMEDLMRSHSMGGAIGGSTIIIEEVVLDGGESSIDESLSSGYEHIDQSNSFSSSGYDIIEESIDHGAGYGGGEMAEALIIDENGGGGGAFYEEYQFEDGNDTGAYVDSLFAGIGHGGGYMEQEVYEGGDGSGGFYEDVIIEEGAGDYLTFGNGGEVVEEASFIGGGGGAYEDNFVLDGAVIDESADYGQSVIMEEAIMDSGAGYGENIITEEMVDMGGEYGENIFIEEAIIDEGGQSGQGALIEEVFESGGSGYDQAVILEEDGGFEQEILQDTYGQGGYGEDVILEETVLNEVGGYQGGETYQEEIIEGYGGNMAGYGSGIQDTIIIEEGLVNNGAANYGTMMEEYTGGISGYENEDLLQEVIVDQGGYVGGQDGGFTEIIEESYGGESGYEIIDETAGGFGLTQGNEVILEQPTYDPSFGVTETVEYGADGYAYDGAYGQEQVLVTGDAYDPNQVLVQEELVDVNGIPVDYGDYPYAYDNVTYINEEF